MSFHPAVLDLAKRRRSLRRFLPHSADRWSRSRRLAWKPYRVPALPWRSIDGSLITKAIAEAEAAGRPFPEIRELLEQRMEVARRETRRRTR